MVRLLTHRKRIRLRGTQWWPDDAGVLPIEKIRQMYAGGFVGAWRDEDSRAALWHRVKSDNGHRMGSDAMTSAGLAGSGAGKLSLPFLAAAMLFPHCYPGCAQEIGDCVSHGASGAALITVANDILRGIKDEVTGVIEGVPEVTSAGIQDDVISSESIYWWRGYNGDGWDCAEAVDVMLQHGVMLRIPYPDLGIDLTNYSGSLAHKYGSQSPPAKIDAVSKQHLIRTATEIDSAESEADVMWNGYGIIDCGGEAWTESTDANGVAKRSGSWSHCVLPDAVIAGPAMLRASDVNVGDVVYGHDGKPHSVNHIFRNQCDGTMVRIKACGIPAIQTTTKHPILVFRRARRSQGTKRLAVVAAGRGIEHLDEPVSFYKAKEKYESIWVTAENLRLGDYLATPIIQDDRPVIAPQWVREATNKTVNRLADIVPSADLAWLFGLYIGDGDAIPAHRITITLAPDNDIERAVRALKTLCDSVSVEDHGTYLRVRAYSAILADSFATWFGTSSLDKHIPEWLLTWDKAEILDGLYHADGCAANSGRSRINTSSRVLMNQLRLLLIDLGLEPTTHVVTPSALSVNPGYAVEWKENRQQNHVRRVDGFIVQKVTSLMFVPYDGDVFNFEVADCNSYIADGVAVHNSMKRIAFDDRPETKSLYGGQPLTLICNNWGAWNSSQYRDIRDSSKWVPAALKAKWIDLDIVNATTGNIMRPIGSFWVRYSEVKNRYAVAMSGANGWKGKDDNFLVI